MKKTISTIASKMLDAIDLHASSLEAGDIDANNRAFLDIQEGIRRLQEMVLKPISCERVALISSATNKDMLQVLASYYCASDRGVLLSDFLKELTTYYPQYFAKISAIELGKLVKLAGFKTSKQKGKSYVYCERFRRSGWKFDASRGVYISADGRSILTNEYPQREELL